ncbi:Diguanylate cyclase (modular protein) [Pseudomonas sp. JV551A1]|uniref:Diguanylate cyclase (Modular protein) n=1 Tax=Pseudomonas inefficax TaxID=2078786 RepID=A0AAQ1PA82_9PSED|nr:Diguanylate cyclase (modular protein) [Pseudomonas sp. JV551A1]SPO60590.1 Diguanylate cyclase (modular protein) [Pseudomonas inefficax]
MGAALAANTGAAGAMHRVGYFAAKAAPTGYEDRLRIQLSVRQRGPKGWAISYSALSRPVISLWEPACRR